MSDGRTNPLVPAALEWLDPWWDDEAGLLWNPVGSFDEVAKPRSIHIVPQTAWYALGLIDRNAPGDRERAAHAVAAVCALQYDEPGTVWNGTFARFAETPPPRVGAVEWVDYDPNWRQFIGTTFSLLRQVVQLPGVDDAIACAVAGEPPDRVVPSYSNIALMKAWLEVEAGHVDEGEALAGAVVDLFDSVGAFNEYNSPTYYGIDLYALALWRSHSSSKSLRDWGTRLEAEVWADVADLYHADLANLCGPWHRSYGMDMRAYAALLGLWICDATPVESASPPPFPDLGQDFDHSHDLALAPLVARLGSHVPAGPVLDALTTFPGEHAVRRELADGRVVTAWLGDDSMIGAEAGGPWPSRGQYHPATMQWRDHSTPTGIGWLRVVTSVPIDATADVLRLDVLPREESDITVVISGSGEGIFIDADGELATEDIDANGLTKVRLTDVTRLTIELRD